MLEVVGVSLASSGGREFWGKGREEADVLAESRSDGNKKKSMEGIRNGRSGYGGRGNY